MGTYSESPNIAASASSSCKGSSVLSLYSRRGDRHGPFRKWLRLSGKKAANKPLHIYPSVT